MKLFVTQKAKENENRTKKNIEERKSVCSTFAYILVQVNAFNILPESNASNMTPKRKR